MNSDHENYVDDGTDVNDNDPVNGEYDYNPVDNSNDCQSTYLDRWRVKGLPPKEPPNNLHGHMRSKVGSVMTPVRPARGSTCKTCRRRLAIKDAYDTHRRMNIDGERKLPKGIAHSSSSPLCNR